MAETPVVLYSVRECLHCQAAREFLQRRGVPFVERDVREEAGAVRDLTKLTGESVVPTIVLGDDVQIGWDEVRVSEMLDNPLPPEEEDDLLAIIEQATAAGLSSPRPDPADGVDSCPASTSPASPAQPDTSTRADSSSGTAVESAEVPAEASRRGSDCTSPAE